LKSEEKERKKEKRRKEEKKRKEIPMFGARCHVREKTKRRLIIGIFVKA
jgi:hypothetical protein